MPAACGGPVLARASTLIDPAGSFALQRQASDRHKSGIREVIRACKKIS
jgi:hypothetical protein